MFTCRPTPPPAKASSADGPPMSGKRWGRGGEGPPDGRQCRSCDVAEEMKPKSPPPGFRNWWPPAPAHRPSPETEVPPPPGPQPTEEVDSPWPEASWQGWRSWQGWHDWTDSQEWHGSRTDPPGGWSEPPQPVASQEEEWPQVPSPDETTDSEEDLCMAPGWNVRSTRRPKPAVTEAASSSGLTESGDVVQLHRRKVIDDLIAECQLPKGRCHSCDGGLYFGEGRCTDLLCHAWDRPVRKCWVCGGKFKAKTNSCADPSCYRNKLIVNRGKVHWK